MSTYAQNPPVTFTLHGQARGKPATITWTETTGFDDPDDLTGYLLQEALQVCATETGPCYPAANTPAVVAWLTAVAALDRVDSWDDPDGVLGMVETEAEIPPGSVS